jgi:hypothetical protein
VATVLETFFNRIGFEVDESALNNAQTKIAGLGKSILGLGIFSGLSVAGLFKLTTATAASLGVIQQVSDRSGIATESIAAMSKAAAAFQVPAEATRGTLENLNRTLGGIVTGTAPRMVKVFETLGLSAKDAAGQQKDVVAFLGDVAQKISGMSSGAQQQILSRLGIDQDMIGMLRNGREEFLRLYQTAAAGIPFRADDYQKAARLEEGFRKVRSAVTEVGQTIALELMPALQDVIDRFMKWWNGKGKEMLLEFRKKLQVWAAEIRKIDERFRSMTGGLGIVQAALTAVATVIGLLLAYQFASWIGNGVKAVKLLAAALGVTTGTFVAIAAAVVALGALIWLLIDDFNAWRRGEASVIGYFEEKFPNAFAKVRAGVESLRDAFVQLWTRIKELWVQVKPQMMFLGKILLSVAAVILGVLVAAFIGLLDISVRVLTKIIELVTQLSKWFEEVLPLETLERYWQQFKDNLVRSFEELQQSWASITAQLSEIWKATTETLSAAWSWLKDQWHAELERFLAGWQTLSGGIRAIWQGVSDFVSGAWNSLREQWQPALDGFLGGWQRLSDGIRSIWSALMGWLEPFLKRIESVFNFISEKSGGLAGKALGAVTEKGGGLLNKLGGWLPSVGPSPSMALAGAGVAPTVPSGAISNANHTSTVTQQTEVKAVINVNGAADPQATGNAVAQRVDELSRTSTRNAQTGDH